MTASYVYGVLHASAAGDGFATPGVDDGPPPHLVKAGDLAALVGPIAADRTQVTAASLRAHTAVLAEAVARATVVPLPFGVVFADDDAVRGELLERRYDELAALLARHDGRVEMNLRAVYDQDAVLRRIVGEDASIARLREEVSELPDDAGYYARIRLGERVAAAVEGWRAGVERDVLTRVGRSAVDVRPERELPERVALKAAFLVDRSRAPEFDRAVEEIAGELAPDVRFTSTGPLALHSFAEMQDAVPA